jgi:hypothetical protein
VAGVAGAALVLASPARSVEPDATAAVAGGPAA